MVIRIQPRATWQATAAAHAFQPSTQSKNVVRVVARRYKATAKEVSCQHSFLLPRSAEDNTSAAIITKRHSHIYPCQQQTKMYQYRASSSWSVPSPAARVAGAAPSTSKNIKASQEQSSKSKFVAPDPKTDYWKIYQDAVKNSPEGVDGVASSLLFRVVLWLRAKASPMTEDIASKLYELFLVHLRRHLFFQQDDIHELLAWYVPRNDLERANKLIQPLIREAQTGKKMRLESKAWILAMLIKQGNESTVHHIIGRPESTWVPYFSDFEKWTRGSLSPSELERARQILREYQGKRLEPNTKRFTHLLMSMFSRGKPEEAIALYQDTLDLGFPTSELVGSAMLNELLKAGLVDETMTLWKRLHGSNAYRPGIATYNNLLSAFSQNPKYLPVAEDLWRFITAPESNVRPDLYTFSNMINAFFRARKTENALDLWKSLREPPFGFEPNLVLYNTVLTGLFRTHRPDLAKLEFEQMMIRQKQLMSRTKATKKKKRGHATTASNSEKGPTKEKGDGQESDELVVTFNIMLQGLLSVQDLEGIQKVRDKMVEFNVEPNLETYTLISDVLFSQRDVKSALKTMDLMERSGVEKSAITYSAMIAGLVKADELERAMEAFKDMKRAGFKPTVHVYGALIQGALRRGDEQLAEEMARQGKALTENGQLSPGAYGILIGHYTNLQRLDRAMAWLLEMNRTTPRQVISWTSYYVLLKECLEQRDWTRAQQVINIMDDNDFHLGVPRLAKLISQVNRELAIQRAAKKSSSPRFNH
ncbi:hypothetical protein BGW42_003158 [Actinomortierella wolfii]|nr:hypothetical protein BGW42_003158 [Actinomortierella wolfii]